MSLHEHVTAIEFTKIISQYLEYTLEKISNLGKLKGISKLPIWFSASAELIETLSVSFACHVHVVHVHESVLC